MVRGADGPGAHPTESCGIGAILPPGGEKIGKMIRFCNFSRLTAAPSTGDGGQESPHPAMRRLVV